MKRLSSLIKLMAFFKILRPIRIRRRRRKRKMKLLALLNPKRAGKVAFHAGKIRMRNEIKRLFY